MKVSLSIFKRDIGRLARNWVALIVTIGVCLIPSLYAWFNIAANFDPYANTGNIKIAVANKDRGTSSELTGDLNAGEEIINTLKENDDLGWVFTDETSAVDGVSSGAYYAAIVIPENFSDSLVSILSGSIKIPEFDYYLNEKKNAIAPKITDTGASTIQTQVNEQFVAAASGAVSEVLGKSVSKIGGQIDSAQESLSEKIKSVSDCLEQYQTVLKNFNDSVDEGGVLIKQTDGVLDNVKSAANLGAQSLNQSTDILSSARTSIGSLTSGLSSGMTQGESILSDLSNAAGTDLGKLNEKVQNVNGQIGSTIESVQAIVSKNAEILQLLRDLDSQVPGNPMADVIAQLESENQRHQEILGYLQTGNTSIGNAADTSANAFNQISAIIQQGQTDIQNSRNSFEANVLPGLNQSLDSFAQLSGRISGILSGVSPSADQLKGLIASLDTTLNDTKTAMNSTKDALSEVQDRLENAVADLGALQSSQVYEEMMSLKDMDSEAIAEFMQSPVQLKTESFYSVANYGSAMTPFYTNLAIWVGGIVLIAIFKMEVDKDEKAGAFTATQAYFGRWMLFVLTGLVQALIICLGDIYILRTQCLNKTAFIFAGLFASFVYVNLIYALSITFKHIGKALSVILVILQIPGSAGTYPIEMTPGFFRALHPFLPFTYGINAMREAMAGMYGHHYMENILCLALFVPVALGIGLVLRPLLLNPNHLFDKKLAETDLMICEEEGMVHERVSLSTAVKILSGQDAFRQSLDRRIEKFNAGYEKKIRMGFLAIIIIPVIFLILMFSIDSKLVFLILWILSIIGIAAYLIVVEYIHESLKRQKKVSELSEEKLLETIGSRKSADLSEEQNASGTEENTKEGR